MSIKIDINNEHFQNADKLQLHFLPAKIHGDGPANVDKYFNNYSYEEHGNIRNCLRGYPLYGQELEVPANYTGVVLQETRKPLDDKAERQLKATGCFDQFTYWNYDKIPTQGDHYRQSLQYLHVAQELAKPVSAEDLEQELSAATTMEHKMDSSIS